MGKEPTKADLYAQIAELENARRDTPEEALVRALAGLVNGNDAARIKHLFYRADGACMQISLDMHGDDA